MTAAKNETVGRVIFCVVGAVVLFFIGMKILEKKIAPPPAPPKTVPVAEAAKPSPPTPGKPVPAETLARIVAVMKKPISKVIEDQGAPGESIWYRHEMGAGLPPIFTRMEKGELTKVEWNKAEHHDITSFGRGIFIRHLKLPATRWYRIDEGPLAGNFVRKFPDARDDGTFTDPVTDYHFMSVEHAKKSLSLVNNLVTDDRPPPRNYEGPVRDPAPQSGLGPERTKD